MYIKKGIHNYTNSLSHTHTLTFTHSISPKPPLHESWHTCEWVMAHIWISHGTHVTHTLSHLHTLSLPNRHCMGLHENMCVCVYIYSNYYIYSNHRVIRPTNPMCDPRQKYCAAIHCNTLQHTATHGNTLQHTATRCSSLQLTATHRNTLQRNFKSLSETSRL